MKCSIALMSYSLPALSIKTCTILIFITQGLMRSNNDVTDPTDRDRQLTQLLLKGTGVNQKKMMSLQLSEMSKE